MENNDRGISILLLIVGIICISTGIYILYRKIYLTFFGNRVKGKITDFEKRNFYSGFFVPFAYVVEFYFNNTKYNIRTIDDKFKITLMDKKPTKLVGKEVTIFFIERNHGIIATIKGCYSIIMASIFLCSGGLLMLIGAYNFTTM